MKEKSSGRRLKEGELRDWEVKGEKEEKEREKSGRGK